jgi:DNA-binding response OmpR family regulator
MTQMLIICDDDNEVLGWYNTLRRLDLQANLVNSQQAPISLPDLHSYDVVTIDLGGTTENIKLCERVRPFVDGALLLFLHEASDAELIAGYEAGADECIVKPLGERVLQAKLNSWEKCIRRFRIVSDDV